jgi:hypothetical protein
LYGTSYIQSSSGYHAAIEYTTKGWISGEVHHFKATVSHSEAMQHGGPTVIEGQWTAKSTLTKHKQPSEPFLDLTGLEKPVPHVAPVSDQGEMESRRIWQKVSEALVAGDYQKASAEKSLIENAQRALRKEREETKAAAWEPKHFRKVDGKVIFGDLREKIIEKADSKFVDTMGDMGWSYHA